MHVFNVRVRGSDAVLLDFYAHRQDPVLCDFASLEASLLVDGFEDDGRQVAEWYQSIRPLYDGALFEVIRSHPSPKEPSCWFYDCARHVRRHAVHWELGQGQYAAALAIALLNKAIKDPQLSGADSDRRAAAWALGELVLRRAFAGSSEGGRTSGSDTGS